MSTEAAKKWLRDGDKESLELRASRLQFLTKNYPEEVEQQGWAAWGGGLTSRLAFEEARVAYLNGLDLATILCVQAWAEKSLVNICRAAGDDVEHLTLGPLVKHARQRNLISAAMARKLRKVGGLRTAVAHGRAPLAPDTLESRALANGVGPDQQLQEDAEFALKFMFEAFRFSPFLMD